MSLKRVRSIVSLALVAASGTSCADALVPPVCTRELRVDVAPDAPVLAVGESVTPSVRLSSCGGSQPIEDRFTWRVADPTVATVDARSGRVTGVAAGSTTLTATGDQYGRVADLVVTVE